MGIDIRVGDVIVTSANHLTEGMDVQIWGFSPYLPPWVRAKLFTELDRQIVAWLYKLFGARMESVVRGTVTIDRINIETNTVYFS